MDSSVLQVIVYSSLIILQSSSEFKHVDLILVEAPEKTKRI